MAQPGDDEKGNEGNGVENTTQFGAYKCVFRPADNALFIMMKNSKTKRTFTSTFSKSTLLEMDLKQPIDKIINLLLDAKSGKKQELTFKIGFGDADTETKGSSKSQQQRPQMASQEISFDKLSKSYLKGSALYIFVNIDNNYFSHEYVFKLLEQERDDMDILRDIIADMQEEIDGLKKKDNQTGIASWYTTHTGGGNIPMTVRLPSTLEGMVTLSQDTRTITVNIPGTYKLSLEVNFTSCTGAGHYINIQVNGTVVGQKLGSNNGGFGYLSRAVNLKKDDKIVFYANHIYATNNIYSDFTVEKI